MTSAFESCASSTSRSSVGPLNKDSFRRRILDGGLVAPTGRVADGVGHRPPALYAFTRRGPRMNLDALIEPLAVLTGIACVALTVRQRIVSWPIGIVSSALFLALFLRAGLYADSALQVLYIGLGFYGWWHWLRGGPSRDALPVTSASTGLRIALVVGTVVATIAVGALPRRRDRFDGPLP